MAMSFGDQFDPGQVGRRDLEAYARDIQGAPRLVWELFEEILEGAQAAVDQASVTFLERAGESPIMEMVRLQIARNLKRARNTTR